VSSRGAEAAYYNPALLPEVESDLDFGLLLVHTQGKIHLSPRPAGVDVPASAYDADLNASGGPAIWPQPTSKLLNSRADTTESATTVYAALGLARPLIDGALVFGLYALLPTNGFLRQEGFFPDEREQFFSNQLHFELLGDRLQVTTVAFALGGRALPWLSWGAGVDIGMGTRTEMQVYIPNAADQRTLLIVPNIHTNVALAPYVAALVRPLPSWVVTATAHAPQAWRTTGENRVRFWNYQYDPGQSAVLQSYELTQGLEPWRIALGAGTSGTVASAGWQVDAQALYSHFSAYIDRNGESPLDQWHDTVNLGIDGALDWEGRRLSLELGVAPSPVPDQSGRTNYVDNTKYAASVGFELPFHSLGGNYVIAFALQGQLMAKRTVTKSPNAAHPVIDEVPDGAIDSLHGQPLPGALGLQTNNPGYPGYSSWGGIVGTSVALRMLR
jgi:long-chain fatty acid transport protein